MEFLRRIALALPIKDLSLEGQINRDPNYQAALSELESALRQKLFESYDTQKSQDPYRVYFRGIPFSTLPQRLGVIQIDRPHGEKPPEVTNPIIITTILDNQIGLTLLYDLYQNGKDTYVIRDRLVSVNLLNWLTQTPLFLDEIKNPTDKQLDLQSTAGIRTALDRVKSWEAIDTNRNYPVSQHAVTNPQAWSIGGELR